MPTLIREKTVTARKPHACQCCGTVAVQPGETYKRATYAFDGRVYDWVSCTECQAASTFVFEWACWGDEGIGPDHYQQWAEETARGYGNSAELDAAEAYLRRRGIEAAR
jgi:hypothetical protein